MRRGAGNRPRENAPVGDEPSPEVPVVRKRSVGRPRRIEADQIVAVARRILQEEGVEAVSMRRVAKEVGATPMALYHHVRDKDELLMLTLSGMAASIPRPVLPEDPRERIVTVALHTYTGISQFSWIVDVLGLGDLTDRSALWIPEAIIGAAVECGLSPTEAVHAYRTVWYVIYGALVFHRAEERRAADPGRRPFMSALVTEEDAGEFPHLAVVAGRWEEITGGWDVEGQLRGVVRGLLAPRD